MHKYFYLNGTTFNRRPIIIIVEFPDAKMIVIHPDKSGRQNNSMAFLRPILLAVYPATKAPTSWLRLGKLAKVKCMIIMAIVLFLNILV